MVILVAIIMLVSCLFRARYTPFYQSYIRVINPISNASMATRSACTFDSRVNRFAWGMGWIFLTAKTKSCQTRAGGEGTGKTKP